MYHVRICFNVVCLVAVGVIFFMFKLSWRLSMVTVIGLPVITCFSAIYGNYAAMGVSNIVTVPARTGITAMSRNAVISQVQTKRGIFIRVMVGARMLRMVATTLIAPMMEDIPKKWIAKIRNGKAAPVCIDSGG